MRAMLWIAVSGVLLGSGSAYASDASPTRSDDTARRGYDDVSYGDIPQATFGAAAATAADAVADGHDDVSYGAAPRVSFALDFPAADETVALGHDDVTYPTAEPRRTSEAAVATSGDEARTSGESRVAASDITTTLVKTNPASGWASRYPTWRASLSGIQVSSASRNAMNSPRASATPRFRATATPRCG